MRKHATYCSRRCSLVYRWHKAGNCLELACSYKAAGDVFRFSCCPPVLSRAAECYCKAACWLDAADTYAADNQLDLALQCCLQGQHWDHGLQLLDAAAAAAAAQQCSQDQKQQQQPTGSSTPIRKVKYAHACAASLHQLQQRQEMMRFLEMLPDSRRRTFLINRGLVSELAAQLIQTHSWREAAAACEEAADLVKAAELYADHGEGLTAGQLLLRQARLLLLWPEAAGLPATAARCQAQQQLLKAAQLFAEAGSDDASAAAATAAVQEAKVLSGLAQAEGWTSPQAVFAWATQSTSAVLQAAQQTPPAVPGRAYLQLLIATEAFSKALLLTVNSNSAAGGTTGMGHSSAVTAVGAATKLCQLWQQLLQVLLPLLRALDAQQRLASPATPEQREMLAACETFMCIRPGSSTAAFRTAERAGMRWCSGLTSAPPQQQSADGQDAVSSSGTGSGISSGGTLQLNLQTMLSRASAYLQWWLLAQGAQFATYLQQLFQQLQGSSSDISSSSNSSSSSSMSGSLSTQGLQLLLEGWQVTHSLLLQQHMLHPSSHQSAAIPAPSGTATDSCSSIEAAVPPLLGRLQEQQQLILRSVLDVLLAPPSTADATSSTVLRTLLQQQCYQDLVDQLAWAVLRGGGGASLSPAPRRLATDGIGGRSHSSLFTAPPPPPQPEGLTYDRIGQLCLLAPLLDPYWLRRAAVQKQVLLWRQVSGPVPWLRLLQAADWLGRARSTNIFNPPQHGQWEEYYPVCNYAWRCCIGLRDYLGTVGVLPVGLRGGLMPHTFCSLLQLAVVAGCAVTTSLHNLLLPQAMAAASMGGQGMAELFSWVVQHGSSSHEKHNIHLELLRLIRTLSGLLLRPQEGFSAWCQAAADVISFHGNAGSSGGVQAGSGPGSMATALQTTAAQQIFWLLLVIAANNRPSLTQLQAAASTSGQFPPPRLPVPVQIQQHFLQTLAKLAEMQGSAIGLLPQRVQLTIQKLLAKAAVSTGAQRSAVHGLQFDAVAAELFAAAAACSMPWTVLYLSYTGSEAPRFARGLKAVMVDRQEGGQPGSDAPPLFFFEQLIGPEMAALLRDSAIGSATATAVPIAGAVGTAAAPAVSAAAAAQPQQPGSSRRSRLGQSEEAELDEFEASTAHASNAAGLVDDEDPLASLTGAVFVRTWVHWRLRCWKARAAARLNRRTSPLERLQQEARAAMAADSPGNAAVQQPQPPASITRSKDSAAVLAGESVRSNEQYLQLYISMVCPVLVRMLAARPAKL